MNRAEDRGNVIEFNLCCDSADFYAWIIKNTDYSFQRNSDYSRTVWLKSNQQDVKINFIHQHSTLAAYNKVAADFLSKTAGTPDYLLFNAEGVPLVCIEDSKTAPVGNAVIQRLDKLWPLLMHPKVTCPVIYVGPMEGIDASQDNKKRSWEQSWFYKSFAVGVPGAFALLEAGEDVCEHVFELIQKAIEKEVCGQKPQKRIISKTELRDLHEAMKTSIRTYNGTVFSGKLFKPNNTDSHPVQSTLMLISEVRESLNLSPITVLEQYREKLLKSKSKRLVRIVNKGINFK